MAPQPGSTYLQISRRAWAALVTLLLLPWFLVLWFATRPSVTPPAAPSRAIAGKSTQFEKLPAGPWGDLEFSRILIEPPSEFIPVTDGKPEPASWVFRDYNEDKLRALWQRAALTPAQLKTLGGMNRDASGQAIVLHPNADFIISLTPDARAVIYSALAEFAENPAQNAPFRLRAELANEWLDDSGLSPEIVTLTKRLFYQRNSGVFFSDHGLVLPRIPTSAERVQFLKTLSRKSTLLVRLQVNRETNTDTLAAYWGRGRRSKDVRPLLQSLARHSGGAVLDIVHLLPPFPRALLYTYPLPSDQPKAAALDCHWSAFNFFSDEPDDSFTSIDHVRETLLKSYYPVAGEPILGDVIVLVQPNGLVVHSCVYVAADIVFTKNGSSFSVPWTLAPLDQVVAFYSLGPALEVRRYRLKTM